MKKKSIKLNIILNYVFKILVMVIGFISVPFTLEYLGVEKYGIWVTLLSVISWMNISDLGIGNGLRNKVTELIAKNNKIKIKEYISTAYISISIISFLVFCMAYAILLIISKINSIDQELEISILIMIIGFCVNLIIGNIRFISYAKQQSALVGLAQVIASGSSLIGIILLQKLSSENLINLSILYNITLIVSNLILSFMIFRKGKEFIPIIIKIHKNVFHDISGLGIKFFIIQACGIIMYSTDNLIISNFIDLASVTEYDLITRVYNSISQFYSLLLVAVWSLVTEAFTKNNLKWIKTTIVNLQKSLILLTIIVITVSLFINKIISFWIQKDIHYSNSLIVIFALYTIILAWNEVYAVTINGIGKINLQLYLSLVGAILNIPLSIYFAKYLNMGILGVKLATLICILFVSFALPIQVHKKLLVK